MYARAHNRNAMVMPQWSSPTDRPDESTLYQAASLVSLRYLVRTNDKVQVPVGGVKVS